MMTNDQHTMTTIEESIAIMNRATIELDRLKAENTKLKDLCERAADAMRELRIMPNLTEELRRAAKD